MHLTYCLNVHPGETFLDQWNAIREFVLPLRDRLRWTKPFGLGLRLGRAAAAEADKHDEFGVWCREHGLYVFTINGFPYGNFHRSPVKSDVYRPDWTTAARRDYTMQLIDRLAGWLPDGVNGSISTVPVGYSADHPDIEKALENIRMVARHAASSGQDICIALEPEPGCMLETTDDVIQFFRALWRGGDEAMLRRHIGVCVDTCHCALAFESPAGVLRALQREGIRIGKIQLSAALAVKNPGDAAGVLSQFNEPVYLHQVAARRGDRIKKWADLPELTGENDWDEIRVHFHVPLDWAGDNAIGSTRDNMDAEFWSMVRGGICPHLEVETYTFGVFPEKLSGRDLLSDLEGEMRWLLDRME